MCLRPSVSPNCLSVTLFFPCFLSASQESTAEELIHRFILACNYTFFSSVWIVVSVYLYGSSNAVYDIPCFLPLLFSSSSSDFWDMRPMPNPCLSSYILHLVFSAGCEVAVNVPSTFRNPKEFLIRMKRIDWKLAWDSVKGYMRRIFNNVVFYYVCQLFKSAVTPKRTTDPVLMSSVTSACCVGGAMSLQIG